jgi:hypothetical protein
MNTHEVADITIDSEAYNDVHDKCMRCCMGFITMKLAAQHIKNSHSEVIVKG